MKRSNSGAEHGKTERRAGLKVLKNNTTRDLMDYLIQLEDYSIANYTLLSTIFVKEEYHEFVMPAYTDEMIAGSTAEAKTEYQLTTIQMGQEMEKHKSYIENKQKLWLDVW